MKIAEVSRQYQIALEHLRVAQDRADQAMVDYAEWELEQLRQAWKAAHDPAPQVLLCADCGVLIPLEAYRRKKPQCDNCVVRDAMVELEET